MYRVIFVNGFNADIDCAMEYDNLPALTSYQARMIEREAIDWTIDQKAPYLIYRVDDNENRTLLFSTIYGYRGLLLDSDYICLYANNGGKMQLIRTISTSDYFWDGVPRYQLHIIWEDNTENTYRYKVRESAEKAGKLFEIAFGKQVKYWWIRDI